MKVLIDFRSRRVSDGYQKTIATELTEEEFRELHDLWTFGGLMVFRIAPRSREKGKKLWQVGSVSVHETHVEPRRGRKSTAAKPGKAIGRRPKRRSRER